MINIRLIVYSDTEPEYKEVGWLHKINDVLVLSFFDKGLWKYTSSGITEDLINAEILNRIDADAALNNRVDTEATTRNSADNVLSEALSTELSTRASADSSLNNAITTENTRAVNIENTISTSVGLDSETKIYTNSGLYIGKLVVNTVTSDIKALDTLTKSNTDNIATLQTDVIEAKTEVKGQTDKVDVVSSTGTDGHIIYTILLDPNFLAIVNNKVDKVTGSSLLSDTEIQRLSTMQIVLTLDGTSTTNVVSQNALKLFKDGIPAQTNAIIDGQLNTGGTIDIAILNKASLFNTGLLGSLTVASADPTPGKNGYYVYTDSGTNTHGTIDAGDTLLVTYDSSVYTYTLIKKSNNINIEYAKNNTGSTIGRGKLIYISGSTGDNPLFLLATNTDYNIAARTWGMTYEGINANAVGRVIHFGLIENLDTSAYTAGTELWLGVNGEYTNVRPTSPAFQTSIGMVIRQHATVGSIFINMRYVNIENVRSQNTHTSPSSKLFDDLKLSGLADIKSQTYVSGNIPVFDSDASGFRKESLYDYSNELNIDELFPLTNGHYSLYGTKYKIKVKITSGVNTNGNIILLGTTTAVTTTLSTAILLAAYLATLTYAGYTIDYTNGNDFFELTATNIGYVSIPTIDFSTTGATGTILEEVIGTYSAIYTVPVKLYALNKKICFYTTLGNVVNYQFVGTDIGEWNTPLKWNLIFSDEDFSSIIESKYILGYYIDLNGAIVGHPDYKISVSRCKLGDLVYSHHIVHSVVSLISFFDSNFTFLLNGTYYNNSYVVPANSSYVIFSSLITDSLDYIKSSYPVDDRYLTDYYLYNINNIVTKGFYIDKNNVSQISADYGFSKKCYCDNGGYIILDYGRNNYNAVNSVAFYDSSNTPISGTNNKLIPVPLGASYFILCSNILNTNFSAKYICDNLVLKRIDEASINYKELFVNKNLYNQSDTDARTLAYLTSGGTVGSIPYSPYWRVTGFIPFNASMGSLVSSVDGTMATPENAYNCLYDANKNLVAAYTGRDNGKLNWILNVAYARFTFASPKSSKLQVEVGTTPTSYLIYGVPVIPTGSMETNKLLPVLKSSTESFSQRYHASSMSATASYVDSYFPTMIKGRNSVLFSGKFATFSGLQLFRGNSNTNFYYKLNITPSLVEFTDGAAVTTQNLTNTISTFISVKMSEDKLFNTLTVDIMTLTGIQQLTFTVSNGDKGSFGFYIADAMTAINFSITNRALKLPVWLFGDSYLDFLWADLHSLTSSNMLIDGYGGMQSINNFNDLLLGLNYSVPKIIIWALGMNDTYSDYVYYANRLIELCNSKGITLILYTVPTIPSRNKEGFKTFVLSTGLRYVDAYSAVGTNASGTWYSNYLQTSDSVHPTALGSKAITMRYLLDVPEILNSEE